MKRPAPLVSLIGVALAVAGGVVLVPGSASAGPGQPVPFLDCVGTDPANGNSIAFFGYRNTGTDRVRIGIGPSNQVVGGPTGVDAGQPEAFVAGTYPRVFSVEFTPAPNALVVWQLNGDLAQANAGSPACRSAVTAPPSVVRATSATLTGVVVPGGVATSYRFEYGPTTAYGSSTPVTSAGEGTAPSLVQAPVTRLRPRTLYYVRIVATNATGTTTGTAQTFTTPRR